MGKSVQRNCHFLLLGVLAPVKIIFEVAGQWLAVFLVQRVPFLALLVAEDGWAGWAGDAFSRTGNRAACAGARKHEEVALLLSEASSEQQLDHPGHLGSGTWGQEAGRLGQLGEDPAELGVRLPVRLCRLPGAVPDQPTLLARHRALLQSHRADVVVEAVS